MKSSYRIIQSIVISLILVFFFQGTINASHILGGEATYNCISSDDDRSKVAVQFKMMRDEDSGGAGFDNPAMIAVIAFGNGQWTLWDSRTVNLDSLQRFNDYGKSYDLGFYNMEVELPYTFEKYMFVYQICCRQENITNIVNSGEAGLAMTLEITTESLMLCNSSPQFLNDISPVLCIDSLTVIDLNLIDSDDDSISIEFCNPLTVGGLVGTPGVPGDPSSCDGVRPNPGDCPPPYDEVEFVFPYTVDNQLGDNFILEGNVLSGTPDLQEVFVFSYCIKEYRDGDLLSVMKKSMTLFSVICDPCDYALSNDFIRVTNPDDTYSIDLLEADFFPEDYEINITTSNIDDISYSLEGSIFDFSIIGEEFESVTVEYEVCGMACNICEPSILTIQNLGFPGFLVFPEIITPNGDGVNDFLKFRDSSLSDESNLSIFNRWGKLIFNATAYDQNWNAEGYPGGIYFYVLETEDEVVKKTSTVVK